MKDRVYPAKILLFGEYSVLLGGNALAIPWKSQFAFWERGNFSQSSELLGLFYYLKSQKVDFLDLDSFYYYIQKGWYLKSNIVQGYGLGSSGSIAAAIYDKFKKSDEGDLSVLRSYFSRIESFYHGHSSGFDPLIAYSEKVIHIQNSVLNCYSHSNINSSNFFLIDSKISRSKNQKVSDTFEKLNTDERLRKSYVKLQNAAINSWSEGKNQLKDDIKKISEFQLTNLPELIPSGLIPWWKEGLNSDHYYIKLCGAGGGGYYLGYTRNFNMLDQLGRIYPIIPLSDYSSVRY